KLTIRGGVPPGFETFTVIEDPRTGGNCKHHLGEMIFTAVSSMVCGVQSFEGMIEFAQVHHKWLERWIVLPNGIPELPTMINLFALLNPASFSQCIAAHLKENHPQIRPKLKEIPAHEADESDGK